MKIDAKILRRMVKEELAREVESQINETGGYGSPRGRAAADENFDAAVQTLIDLMGVTRDRAITAVQSLRSGGQAGDTWHSGMNQGSPDAQMRAETDEMEDAEEMSEIDEEEVDEGDEMEELDETEEGEEGMDESATPSLTDEMSGHLEGVMEEALDRTPVREDFNSNRLAHLAGILED